ncbi:MAG: porin [Boseongicola sp.]|nr:porin [Boseongicola sp.]
MKTILLTSTALVMAAGMAAAEVGVTGDGRMGVISTNGADIGFTSRIRIVFTATGETDSGLTFGGTIRADNAAKAADGKHATAAAAAAANPTGLATGLLAGDNTSSGGGVSGAAGSVYIAGAFGKITMGDTDGAPKAAVGNAGGVGLTGLGDKNEIAYLSGAPHPSVLWNYTMGDLTLYASADNPGPAGDQALGGALTYSIGDVGVGIGVERLGDTSHVAAGVTAALGDASVKLVYGSRDDDDPATNDAQFAASASFTSGSATFSAFTSRSLSEQDHFGIGAAFDLGGGASIKGGFADGDSLNDPSFDLGVTMSF